MTYASIGGGGHNINYMNNVLPTQSGTWEDPRGGRGTQEATTGELYGIDMDID